ncbi:BrxA/BrxB family bacilliredoxin [Staphylococcus aureus]|nr:BrxA/BrxB family bacilliredoxin [Staphylococcus aureus]
MDMNFDLYMNGVVEQARNEIESAGYEQLTTAEDVDKVLKQDGTTLVMINSVCGCAGGIARPAASHALHYDVLPDRLVTVFAGQDKEATQRAREYFEGHDVMNVINQLQTLFNKYCEER